MKSLIILFTLLFCCFNVYANERVTLTEKKSAIYDFTLKQYQDKEGTFSVDTLKNKPYDISSNHLSKGYRSDVLWYRFELYNATNQALTYYLHFSEKFIHQVDFYLLDSSTYIHKTAGIATLSKSNAHVASPSFKIELQANETKEIVLKIASKYPVFTNIFLFDKESLNSYEHQSELFYTFFIAAILALLLYNISIFFFTKEVSYLYYVLYGACFVMWQSVQIGLAPFTHLSSSAYFYTLSLCIPLMLGFITLFTRSLLDVKKAFPRLDKILLGFVFVLLVLFVVGIFDFFISIIIVNALAFILLPFLFYVGVLSYVHKNRIAVFYLLAQVTFIALSTLFALAAFGLLEFNFYTRNGIIVGSFVEMILFSFALAYRIRLLEKEKLSIIQEANEALENKVKARTQELEKSKEHLKKLANHDPMTNLYNRRSLFSMGKKLINLAKRERKPLSLIMFDLDRFKHINDEYGHGVGDSVIVNFSWCLKSLRRSDVLARIGGEEFVAILPNTNKEDAFHIAEGIRKECAQMNVLVETSKSIQVTVSAGVTTLLHDKDTKLEELLFRADKQLYEAKRAGRNIVK